MRLSFRLGANIEFAGKIKNRTEVANQNGYICDRKQIEVYPKRYQNVIR